MTLGLVELSLVLLKFISGLVVINSKSLKFFLVILDTEFR